MKSSHLAIVFSFILAATANPLWAQPYTLDENGNGTYYPIPDQVYPPLPFQVAPYPTGGITNSSVLIYNLEEPVVSGDVALVVPGQSAISKLLRFTAPDAQNNSHLIYYSQPDGTLAGVGIPASTNPVTISEVSPVTTWGPAPFSRTQPGATLNGGILPYQSFVYLVQVGGTSRAYFVRHEPDLDVFRWHFQRAVLCGGVHQPRAAVQRLD